jgi:TetR/AcrR family transcriptional regulator
VVKSPPAELARRLVDASEEILRPGHDLRLEDIAALVGSARATLYYYFSGRDDLIAFLLDRHVAAAAAGIVAAARADQPARTRLRQAVAALAAFLGEKPGVCAGLLTFAGTSGRLGSVMAAKDTALAAPVQEILADGARSGDLLVSDPADAANAILGAIMIATLARWDRGADSRSPAFQQALADQAIRGVLPPG